MYSRYENPSKRPVRLPEHYGGSAFSQEPTAPFSLPKREPVRSFSKDGVGEKVSPVADRLMRAEKAEEKTEENSYVPAISDEIIEEAEECEDREEKAEQPPAEKSVFSSPINFAGLRRLLGGKEGEGGEEKDRLLLLGLILLLSRTEGDSDILLWLSLLLLCG